MEQVNEGPWPVRKASLGLIDPKYDPIAFQAPISSILLGPSLRK